MSNALKYSVRYTGDRINPDAAQRHAKSFCPDGYEVTVIDWGTWDAETISYGGETSITTWEVYGTVWCRRRTNQEDQ